MYLDGHEGHRGNVLAHAYVEKLNLLIEAFGRLERSYLDSRARKTEFEITNTQKTNPTTVDLKPVPRAYAYDPVPAFVWGIRQLRSVQEGERPDERVTVESLKDFVKLASHDDELAYKRFWINGHADEIRFDECFRHNAERLKAEVEAITKPLRWHRGASIGEVVGELKAVDDITDGHQFVVVPLTGPKQIVCVFPTEMKNRMGEYLFKKVRVRGRLHYREDSPFPFLVDAEADGITIIEPLPRRKTLAQLRGSFSGIERPRTDWGALING